jgi:Ca2+-binding RTX toxin-like protein
MGFLKEGNGFLVNTTTALSQTESSITTLVNGRFVVTWTDWSGGGGDPGIAVRGQVFNANGTKSGGEFLVNTTTAGTQDESAVTALSDGRFVVTWTDQSRTGGDTSIDAVRGQIFNANGTKSGGEFLVNTTATASQSDSGVAALSNGGFVVTWTDSSATGGDTSGAAVRGQIFNASGGKSGGEFLVNTTTAAAQDESSVTTLANGRFVVTWTDFSKSGADTSGDAVRGQVFNANGTRSGGEFLVNATTVDFQYTSDVTALDDGRFVVTWADQSRTGGDLSGFAVRGQIFNANGGKSGGEFLVNTSTVANQFENSVAALSGGRFVVTWTDRFQTGSNYYSAIYAQVFSPDGSRSGDEFQVSTLDEGRRDSSVTVLDNDRFVVSWTDFQSAGDDPYPSAVRAQIFDATQYISDGLNGSASGGDFDDVFLGLGEVNRFRGEGGDDWLNGGGANDTLSGGDGNDLLIGGSGADYLSGGTGLDRASYETATASVIADLSAASGNSGHAAGDTYNSIENLTGSDFVDRLTGTGAANSIIAGGGNDLVFGLAGNDGLYGQDGNDTLTGGTGGDYLSGGAGSDRASYASATKAVIASLANPAINSGDAAGDTFNSIENLTGSTFNDYLSGSSAANAINGGAGNDVIRGYAGNDMLTGGAGIDTFVYNTTLNASTNVDTITDYSAAADTIQIDNAVFTALTATGVLAAAAFRANTTGLAQDSSDRIIYETDTGELYYDANGSASGGGILFAKVSAGLALTNADFVVI